MSQLNLTQTFLVFCLCAATAFAACVPANIPTEDEDVQERSGSRCTTALPNSELEALRTNVETGIRYLKGNMTAALNTNTVDEDNVLSIGFYQGKPEGRSDQEMLAFAVTYLCCSVRYTLDVLKQEAVNPIFGVLVSGYFHNVYDILDPASVENVAANLNKLVNGAQLNNCVIPNESVCNPMSIEQLGAPTFAATLAQDYQNLADDLLHSMNAALSS